MQEISEKTLFEALNAAEGTWCEMPFPADNLPEGHKAEAIRGTVGTFIFLTAKATLPGDITVYDGTVTMPPATFVHLTPAVAEAAFLKGTAWLQKKKTG